MQTVDVLAVAGLAVASVPHGAFAVLLRCCDPGGVAAARPGFRLWAGHAR